MNAFVWEAEILSATCYFSLKFFTGTKHIFFQGFSNFGKEQISTEQMTVFLTRATREDNSKF